MKNGKYEENGSIFWYRNGKIHREDGPAIELFDGNKSWWTNDNRLTEEEFNQWCAKKELNEKLHTTLMPRPKNKNIKI